jgi:hypothetical protein
MSTTASKREVRKVSSRWPVTVAAVFGGVALLLVAYVALRSDQNDVLSFAGVPSEVVVESDAGLSSWCPPRGDDVQVSQRRVDGRQAGHEVEVVGGSLVIRPLRRGGRWLVTCSIASQCPLTCVRIVGEEHRERRRHHRPVDIETSGGVMVVTNLTSTEGPHGRRG